MNATDSFVFKRSLKYAYSATLLIATCCLLAGGPFLAWGAAAKSYEPRSMSTEDRLLYYSNSVEQKKFSFSPAEKKYMATSTGKESCMGRQLVFPGVHDAFFSQLVLNSGKDEPSTANPGAWMLTLHYPQKTGHAAVDTAIRQLAKKRFMEILPADPDQIAALNPDIWLASAPVLSAIAQKIDGMDILLQSFADNLRSPAQAKRLYTQFASGHAFSYDVSSTYVLARPSGRYVSVIFTEDTYWGGAHCNNTSKVLTFDVQTGKQISLPDVLPDSAASIPLIQKYLGLLAEKYSAAYGTSFPDLYSKGDTDGVFNDPAKTVPDINKIALTEQGLMFIFDPYGISSYSEGTILLVIPREALPSLGVATHFWNAP